MNDKGLHRLTIISMVVVALIAAVVSFTHIFALASRYGQPVGLAGLYPFATDGVIAATSLTLYRFARVAGMRAPRGALIFLTLGILATLAANFAYGIPFGFPAAVLSCWPAVAFVGCIDVLVASAKKMIPKPEPKKLASPKIEVHVSGNGGTKDVTTAKRAVTKSKPRRHKPVLTNEQAARIAAERGCSTRTVRNHPEWWNVPEMVN